MGAAHLNWAVPEGTTHVEGSRPPRWANRPMRMGRRPREAAWPPRATLGRSPSSLAQPPPFLGGGVDAPPPPLYKGGPSGGGEHPTELSLPIVWRSSPLFSSSIPPPLIVLSPTWFPCRSCTGLRLLHRCTPSCCGFCSGVDPYRSTSGYLLDRGSGRSHRSPYACEYSEEPS